MPESESPAKNIGKGILFRRKSGIRWLPPFFWYCVIFWFSSRTQSQLPANIPDFLSHFGEFLILGFLVARAYRPKAFNDVIRVFLVLIVLALGDECHQWFVPTRIFSFSDILVDAWGAVAGIVAARVSGAAGKPRLQAD